MNGTAPGQTGPLADRVQRIEAKIDALPEEDGRKRTRAALELHRDLQAVHSEWKALPDDHPDKADLKVAIRKTARRLLHLAFSVDPNELMKESDD